MHDLPPSSVDAPDKVHEQQLDAYADHFASDLTPISAKLSAFPRYVDRTSLARFLVRYEIFKLIGNVQGSIVECGVFQGAGLFSYANFSALLEPLNHRRHVLGFDTFEGFPGVHDKDRQGGSSFAQEGAYAGASVEQLERSVELFDSTRALSNLPKVELIAGDFLESGPAYVEANPHLVVALLYLDFDLYEPTARALELFLPRMPKGAVLAFDEVNVPGFPGETRAMLEKVDIRALELRRMPFTSICWAVL